MKIRRSGSATATGLTCSISSGLLALAVLLCLAACSKSKEFMLVGTVEKKVLELSAPISEVIVDLPVSEGARVDEGQLVVQLDTEVAAAELLAQEAALTAAKALFSETSRDYQRQENLRRSNVASPQALDSARRKKDEAGAAVAEKEARIVQAKKRLDDLTIRAHAAGIIDQLPFERGERAPAGGVVAVVITDEKPWVRVWLPSRIMAKIKIGLNAEIKIIGYKDWIKGTVDYISREPEFTPHYALTEKESSHLVYESRIIIEAAPKDLRPGLSAQIRLMLPRNIP